MKQHDFESYDLRISPIQERRWLVLTFAIAIFTAAILGAPRESWSATAKECRTQTPLPANVRPITPGIDVPEALARFAGAWIGVWLDQTGREALCHTLVIEEVLPNGYARIIYSIGTSVVWNYRQPDFWRVTGRIIDGVLRFRLPVPDQPSLTYRFDGETLMGSVANRESRVSLIRIGDLAQVNCGSQNRRAPRAPSTDGPRDRLTADTLLAPTYKGNSPVHNNYFLPMGKSAPALHSFKGILTVGASSLFRANHGCAGLTTISPAFSAAIFTHGEHLVPTPRDILQPPGTIILSPGKTWSEPGDRGMSRASFPFVLVGQSSYAARNGLASFLFDDRRVSALQLQIVQETAGWEKFDLWGQAPMTYTPGPLPNESMLRNQFVAELKQQTPLRPWSELPKSAKATALLERFDGDAITEDISANGLIIDGTIYLRGCNTRYGPYSYCREMRHSVFSVTKSLGAAVAMLRLAQKYGDEVFDLKIKDYVPVTAGHDGWERVTFGDALNMATGIGDFAPEREPNNPLADENKPKMFKWERARTAKEKLDVSFSYGKYSWGPGEVLRYNSTHTFVLAAAMDSFLKRRVGPNADLWDMVVSEVFQPIGISYAPMLHTVETDGRGIPLLAVGLYPTIDDIAKLTRLLQNGGRYQDRQLLSAAKLAQALDKSGAAGLPIGEKNRFGDVRYHLSFWSVPYRTDDGCFFQVPYMAGYGGNLVVLLPNGLSAFRFADGFNFDLEAMILAGESLRPFCSAPPAQMTPSAKRQPLTAAELNAVFSGHTFYGDDRNMFAAADGVIYQSSKNTSDLGKWRIAPEGQFCRAWWDRPQERCYVVYREGETLELYPIDRWGKLLVRRIPGNPESY